MEIIPALIGWPALAAVVIPLLKNRRARGVAVYAAAAGMMALALALLGAWMADGKQTIVLAPESVYTEYIDLAMLAGEFLLMGLIVALSIRHRKYPVILLSAGQTLLVAWSEIFHPVQKSTHLRVDGLAMLLCIIAAFVGGFICIYAVGYMKAYHEHHKEYKDRSGFFFSMLFLFLAAMFGLVLSENLVWMYFFWEVTSVVSFLLIGYTRTEEAIANSFRALWMNLLGGFGFAIAIVYMAWNYGVVQLAEVIAIAPAIPVALLAFAALTKSAQLPFSSWLLGAMVAPTPSSALLHSATMVKAGVYLLIRLAPALAGTTGGAMVSFLGGFTFLAASMMAIAQNDGKKVLAFSTVSNLGLIVACAGIGEEETVWAAVLLMIFHSVAKSMLFQAVGSIENALGTRDIEAMHGLLLRLPRLTYIMGIGIAGMYLAPFGMLISKWVALKSFVDSSNYLLVIFLAYGSATTMFYWTKWLSKLVSLHHTREPVTDHTHRDQYLSMAVHAAATLGLCLLFPLVSDRVVDPIVRTLLGSAHAVLSMNVLTTMVIMVVSVLFVPTLMFVLTRSTHRDYVPIYMGGANEGDNTYFVNSYGEPEHLYLSNWYMRFEFGMRRLMRPAVIVSAGVLAVMLCVIVGGAV
ncbi:NADH-quinone oxidoreductase subunit L [uncultured Subdoligranulum sp.]|uniref:NADH-quinone oxidoreductase subunit 5 family protein n=1 Tax=uncultured Subdoligranulum sp. TaxID=512298 RepID=UPI00262A7D77|nr:proton-conducting transporter membrane subunit [uncultured Subdoligranulum sp.]